MPCSFCRESGHNKRTCQYWNLVLLAREARVDQLRIENEQRLIDLTPPVQENIPRTPPETPPRTPPSISRTVPSIPRTPPAIVRPIRRRSLDENNIIPEFPYPNIYNENTLLDGDLIQSPAISPTVVDCPIATEDCAICMEKLTSANLFIGPCGHQFHAMCIVQHIKTRSNCLCPLCRVQLHY